MELSGSVEACTGIGLPFMLIVPEVEVPILVHILFVCGRNIGRSNSLLLSMLEFVLQFLQCLKVAHQSLIAVNIIFCWLSMLV
jgi:hypothetical protein